MAIGFFSNEEVRGGCGSLCKLSRTCKHPRLAPTGEGKKGILVIAEAPGEKEDEEKLQLFGPAGQLLRTILKEFGIDLDRDCRKTNAVRCRPPDNRKPTIPEILACQSHVWDEIRQFKPRMIFLLGQSAIESILLERLQKIGPIGKWRGMIIPDQKTKCWVCPMFHPNYLLRIRDALHGKQTAPEEYIFEDDIRRALTYLDKPMPITPTPQFVTDLPIKKDDIVTIDYETTGLRPYRRGHKIVTASVSDGVYTSAKPMDFAYAKTWKKFLASEDVFKVAHNIKFEHKWAHHCLGTETKGWIWDTMVAAHVLDNRREITSLECQAYMLLGIEEWKKETSEIFDQETDGFNQYAKTGATEELLRRNALDSFYTHLLFQRQQEIIK